MNANKEILELIKGQSLLDRNILRKKSEFFYKTSDDIIYQGDLGNERIFYDIFKEFGKKAKIKAKSKPKVKTSKSKTRNKPNHNAFQSTNSLNKPNATITSITTKPISSFNHTVRQADGLGLTVSKPHHQPISLFKKSQSLPFMGMGNTMTNHIKFLKSLDDRIAHLDQEIAKSSYEPILKLPSSLIVQSKSRIIDLFLDYFDSNKSKQIKTRYKHLYGDENYFKKVKAIKYSKAISLGNDNGKVKPQTSITKSKTSYIRVMNDYPFNTQREIVKNKYDRVGNAKVLNIPIEFFNHNDEVKGRDKGIEDNVSEMYYSANKGQRTVNRITKRVFYSIENKKGSKGRKSRLMEIKDEFNTVEIEGKKINRRILNLKKFFNKKSPVVNRKILAFVKDPFEFNFNQPTITNVFQPHDNNREVKVKVNV